MIDEEMLEIFRKVFEDPNLVIADDMSAADIEKWDSLAHIHLIVEIEKFFRVKFKNAEIARLQCIGDLKRLVVKHKPELA